MQCVSVSRDNSELTVTHRVRFNCAALATIIDVLCFPCVSWQLRIVLKCSFIATDYMRQNSNFDALFNSTFGIGSVVMFPDCWIPPHMGCACRNVAERMTGDSLVTDL